MSYYVHESSFVYLLVILPPLLYMSNTLMMLEQWYINLSIFVSETFNIQKTKIIVVLALGKITETFS